MDKSAPVISTGPLPHPAMDYDQLRAEGLRLLGELAGTQWTDFNTHDPGVTILEQLCYAITDLAYRCNYPMADLLAPAHGQPTGALAGPAEILPGDPVSLSDWRKGLYEVEGVQNAWLDLDDPAAGPQIYRRQVQSGPDQYQFNLQPEPNAPNEQALTLRGVVPVQIQPAQSAGTTIDRHDIDKFVQPMRPLGMDFEPRLLAKAVSIRVKAELEVSACDDPQVLLADLIEHLEDYLNPTPQYQALAEARQSASLAELLETRLTRSASVLTHLPQALRRLHVSDLIHAMTDVAQVRSVRSITEPSHHVDIPQDSYAVLSGHSELILRRAGLPLKVDFADAADRVAKRRQQRRAARQAAAPGLTLPAGRDRHIERYRSVQHQFPAVYGIGPLGLSAAAPVQRQAQVRQLQAYLLIFDQLLANQFAQLAHAHQLLSPAVAAADQSTYFSQRVSDAQLDLAALYLQDTATVAADADDEHADQHQRQQRQQRFLAHQLARFAEQVGDRLDIHHVLEPDTAKVERERIQHQHDFLADYPRLSSGRGRGFDPLADPLDDDSDAPLCQRLRLKFGWPELLLGLVEHILLRPIEEDRHQLDRSNSSDSGPPLLKQARHADPWSCRISVVCKRPAQLADETEHEAQFSELQGFVEQTVRDEVPAHLHAQLVWLGDAEAEGFAEDWRYFRASLHDYRSDSPAGTLQQLKLRDARDRLIERLELGLTYPLRDLPWRATEQKVAKGETAKVRLGLSQHGVRYELLNSKNELQNDVVGTGDKLVLATAAVTDNDTYRIRAIKDSGGKDERTVFLQDSFTVKVGLDTSLGVDFVDDLDVLPLLDRTIQQPTADNARLARYGQTVTLLVNDSQEGVTYALRDNADRTAALPPEISEPKMGTSGPIELKYQLAHDDIDLCVLASKSFETAGKADEDFLTQILPLRVSANPTVVVADPVAVVDWAGTAVFELAGTQDVVEYQGWIRDLRDSDYVFEGDPPAGATLDLHGKAAYPGLKLKLPAAPASSDPVGFHGPRESQGSGTTRQLNLSTSERDVIGLIKATKMHLPRAKPADTSSSAEAPAAQLPSTIWLNPAVAVLVRPNPKQVLMVQIVPGATEGRSTWTISRGQPGVYYRFPNAEAPREVYFHQRDEADAHLNKGIGRLRIGVDLALAREAENPATPATAPTSTAPPDPQLDMSAGLKLSDVTVTARKAMTGLTTQIIFTR